MEQMKAAFTVTFCLAISRSSCVGPTVQQIFAQCEADAFAVLSLQTDELV